MASVLGTLKPLASLLLQADNPVALARSLSARTFGPTAEELCEVVGASVTDSVLVEPVLRYAAIVDEEGRVTSDAPVLLAQAQILVEAALEERWDLVLTVPPYLRSSLQNLPHGPGPNRARRETRATLGEIAGSARERLLIAAPYLHPSLVSDLADPLAQLFRRGGRATVVTRAISWSTPDRSTPNIEAVAALRRLSDRNGGTLTVRSWEQDGIGIHFKVVVADGRMAYLGSANLTPGGTVSHAEAGVLVRGSQVAWLEQWLLAVADELGRRRLLAG